MTEYLTVRFNDLDNFDAELQRKSRAGWRLHSCLNFTDENGFDILAVFEREAKEENNSQIF